MRNALSRWIERKLAEGTDEYWHESELCGDLDSTHAPLGTGEVVCCTAPSGPASSRCLLSGIGGSDGPTDDSRRSRRQELQQTVGLPAF